MITIIKYAEQLILDMCIIFLLKLSERMLTASIVYVRLVPLNLGCRVLRSKERPTHAVVHNTLRGIDIFLSFYKRVISIIITNILKRYLRHSLQYLGHAIYYPGSDHCTCLVAVSPSVRMPENQYPGIPGLRLVQTDSRRHRK